MVSSPGKQPILTKKCHKSAFYIQKKPKNNYSPLLDFKNFCQMDGTIDKIHKK